MLGKIRPFTKLTFESQPDLECQDKGNEINITQNRFADSELKSEKSLEIKSQPLQKFSAQYSLKKEKAVDSVKIHEPNMESRTNDSVLFEIQGINVKSDETLVEGNLDDKAHLDGENV
jgi:hypothetical protein